MMQLSWFLTFYNLVHKLRLLEICLEPEFPRDVMWYIASDTCRQWLVPQCQITLKNYKKATKIYPLSNEDIFVVDVQTTNHMHTFILTREPRPSSLHIGTRHPLCIKHEILKLISNLQKVYMYIVLWEVTNQFLDLMFYTQQALRLTFITYGLQS